jgi:hypothetical protein
VSEAFQMMAAYQIAITECLQSTGNPNNCNPGEYGIPVTQAGTFGKVINISNSVIEFIFTDENKHDLLKNGIVWMTPELLTGGSYKWNCAIKRPIESSFTPSALNCQESS